LDVLLCAGVPEEWRIGHAASCGLGIVHAQQLTARFLTARQAERGQLAGMRGSYRPKQA
jgi:hypothetical protein